MGNSSGHLGVHLGRLQLFVDFDDELVGLAAHLAVFDVLLMVPCRAINKDAVDLKTVQADECSFEFHRLCVRQLRTHGKNGALRQSYNAHGGAAEENLLNTGMAVCCYDDKIDVFLFGFSQDFLMGLARSHRGLGSDT